ncbi:MAG: agmatinase [Cyclobacteriaceae bacterium]|nr:agmatinase [Cyclobacteriaceae bacterium]
MVGVAGIPLDENSSFLRGPALAPAKIREAFHSDSANYFTESGRDMKNDGGWEDAGDLHIDGEAPMDKISSQVATLLVKYKKLLCLGGDHSISFPIIRGFNSRHKDLTILHLDAHADLYHDFEGNPYSHASPFARIMEAGLAKRLIQIGIRTLSTHQREQAKKFGVEIIEMRYWRDDHKFSFDGPVYISLDMDAIDPAFAPGVSHHEPGGFTVRQVLHILQTIRGHIVGADLVEFNPSRDPSGVTAMLAAKLYKEMVDLLIRTA